MKKIILCVCILNPILPLSLAEASPSKIESYSEAQLESTFTLKDYLLIEKEKAQAEEARVAKELAEKQEEAKKNETTAIICSLIGLSILIGALILLWRS